MGRRKKKPEEKQIKSIISQETMLSLLKTGALIGMVVLAPGTMKMMKGFQRGREWDEYYPSSIARTAVSLHRKGLVEIIEEGGMQVVKITHKGHIQRLQYDFSELKFRSGSWDGKWRIVMFDVPDVEKKIRDILRGILLGIGFFPFQESVFITPYPCDDEVAYIREIYHIPHMIKLILAETIENEEELRVFFKI